MLFTVPRYLQKFASQVLLGILNSSSSKRATADLALRFARGHARRRWNGEAGFAREALYRACRAGVFVPILNKLGFDRLELVICAGAPLPPETMALWQMLGVNVVEMYGQTETAGGIISRPARAVSAPRQRRHRGHGLGGQALPATAKCWCRVPICSSATGTIRTQPAPSRARTAGCAPATSANGTTSALRLVDRARDFIVTSGGKTISPSFIENILRSSPYVAEVVVFGHGRKYLTALDRDRRRYGRRLGPQP